MRINQLLEFLQKELGELNWTISPDLNLGIVSTNTFEISKNQNQLTLLFQKLKIVEKTEDKNMLEDLPKEEGISRSQAHNPKNMKQKNLKDFNYQNPVQLANFLVDPIQKFLPNMKIKATGPYLNLDLSEDEWSRFLHL